MAKTHGTAKPSLSVGDIVIVHNEQLPRGLWKLRRIQELLEGCYRGAIVKTVTRDGQPEMLRRPIQHLYPLEVESAFDSNESTVEKTSSPKVVTPTPVDIVGEDSSERVTNTPAVPPSRPRRIAAQRGEERRKACMIELNED